MSGPTQTPVRESWCEPPVLSEVGALARALTRCHTAPVKELTSERVGFALRQLAEDVVTERRRVRKLERENRELRAQLELLTGLLAETSPDAVDPDERCAVGTAA